MRRIRSFPSEDILIAHLVPGFFLCVTWAVMYEVYHEDGSYYTTLIQEILGTEGLFPYFLATALLMALPVGFLVDTVREVVGEVWLGLPGANLGRRNSLPLVQWAHGLGSLPADFENRFGLYRHVAATVLIPAKAAGNLALILLALGIWFVVKIIQMGGWQVFSLTFIIGAPIVDLGLVLTLGVRYVTGFRKFYMDAGDSIFPLAAATPSEAVTVLSPPASAVPLPGGHPQGQMVPTE